MSKQHSLSLFNSSLEKGCPSEEYSLGRTKVFFVATISTFMLVSPNNITVIIIIIFRRLQKNNISIVYLKL